MIVRLRCFKYAKILLALNVVVCDALLCSSDSLLLDLIVLGLINQTPTSIDSSSEITELVAARNLALAAVFHLRLGGGHSETHTLLHPSSETVFPSSHVSTHSFIPSPQTAN